MSREILKRLEALEASRPGAGLAPSVSLMTLCEDGTWDLACGLWDGKAEVRTIQSHHQTQEEAQAAYDSFLQAYQRGRADAVLIINDLQADG